MLRKRLVFYLWLQLFIEFLLWNLIKSEIFCPDPGVPQYGSREGDSFKVGAEVRFKCFPGYDLLGSGKRHCSRNGDWTGELARCNGPTNYCPNPGIPIDGMKIGDSYNEGVTIKFHCRPGFIQYGSNERTCMADRTWNGTESKCIELLCNRPRPLANGNIPELEKTDFNNTFPNHFVLTYDCNEGYRLQGGDPWRVCGKDGWSGNDPYCENIFCPDPGEPQHGSREGNSFEVGAAVRFKCLNGYDLLGSAERYCTPHGKWTGELARCNAPTNYCPNPGIPINGMKIGDSYDKGVTIKFRCRSGFFQYGTKERTCMTDRTWNGTETMCLGLFDFDNSQEIGDNLRQRLDDEGFLTACKKYISARKLTGMNRRPIEVPPDKTLILYFAIDVSNNMTPQKFKKGIDFAKAFVRKIGISENSTRVGALTFGDEVRHQFFPMDNFKSDQYVLDLLDSIEHTGGGASLTSLLKAMKNTMVLVNHFFLNKKYVLFIITDGKLNTCDISCDANYNVIVEEEDADIFWISFKGDQSVCTLNEIVSSSQHAGKESLNIFIFENYGSLNWMIQDIINGTIDYSQCGLGMESKMNSNPAENKDDKKSLEPWPWMASLFFRDHKNLTAKPELKCSGTIINDNFILTSAFCLFERDGETLEYRRRSEEEIVVKLGLVDPTIETVGQMFQVEKILCHEDYMPGHSFDNDIALLKLKKLIAYSPFVRPVCLPPAVPPEDNYNPLYTPGEYGWDVARAYQTPYQKNVNSTMIKQVRELRLTIQPNEMCKTNIKSITTDEELFFTERMFCAAVDCSVGRLYLRDAGGCFMQPNINSEGETYWTQVGIFAWTVLCVKEYFTHVQRFRPWIEEKIKENK